MESRAAWSAAGVALLIVCGTNAVAWFVAAAPADSPLPWWPALAFGLIAAFGVYVTGAALGGWPPFRGLRSAGELVDECIRNGRAARERIRREGLTDTDATLAYATWFLRTSNVLDRRMPALTDEFQFAAAQLGAQAQTMTPKERLVAMINLNLDVLTKARR